MGPSLRNELLDRFEELVDRHKLAEVVDILAEVCSMKADHIRENWQDDALADEWDICAAALLRAGNEASAKHL